MSSTIITEGITERDQSRTRKRKAEATEIEIDVDAPEPPSKKALRRAKRARSTIKNAAEPVKSKPKSASEQHNEPQEQKRSAYGIWVGNLSFATTKADLLKFLTGNAENMIHRDQITRIHLPQGPSKSGQALNRGFAYIDFIDEESLKIALKLSETLVGGRRVLIKNAKDFEGRPEQHKKTKEETSAQTPSKRLFVGNLGFDTTVEDLEKHFGACGSIIHTHVATFEDSGKCKGFAWIDFEQLASAESAMRGWVGSRDSGDGALRSTSPKQKSWLHKLHGRKLRMEYAEDKATRYQKRFGKKPSETQSGDSKGNKGEQVPIQEVAVVEDESQLVSDAGKIKATKMRPGGKYAEETVQRLTGAIVESKGQRTVFE